MRRLLLSIPVLIAVTIIAFIMLELAPGDPASFFISPELGANPSQIEQLRTAMGLDAPAHIRYFRWLGQVLRGNLGYRMKNGDSVSWIIGIRLRATILLVGAALVLGTLVGIALGIFTALRRNTVWDHALTGLSFVGISMPAYISGLLGLYFLSFRARLFPSGGMQTIGQDPSLLDLVHHLMLPSLTLAVAYLASNMRYTRSSMLGVLSEDYITTARSKGLPETIIVRRHALRNALMPVVTVFGLNLPNLAAGAVFIESIFSWPGMGSLYLDAIQARDYPLIMGSNLVIAVFVLIANILTDVLYALVDPRITYD